MHGVGEETKQPDPTARADERVIVTKHNCEYLPKTPVLMITA